MSVRARAIASWPSLPALKHPLEFTKHALGFEKGTGVFSVIPAAFSGDRGDEVYRPNLSARQLLSSRPDLKKSRPRPTHSRNAFSSRSPNG
jgi:hypothetical protein